MTTTNTLTSSAAIILAALSSHAGAITITNHSFETDSVSGNTLGGQPPADWSQTNVGTDTRNGTAYTIDKVHSNVKPPAPDDGSDQMAMLRYDALLYQVLGTNIAPNTSYTLTVDAADRIGNRPALSSNGTIRLGTGSTAGANLLSPDSISTGATSNAGWTVWTATFSTGASVPSSALRVELVQFGVAGQDAQGLFDNVRLTSALVPEPSSLALLGLGGMLIARRRR